MKIYTPEISWHAQDPVLSLDIQCYDGDLINDELDDSVGKEKSKYRLVTGSYDQHILIWLMTVISDSNTNQVNKINFDVISDLNRHMKPVNVARFAPIGGLLASGDNDGHIIVWKQETSDNSHKVKSENNGDLNDDYGVVNKEQWSNFKILRGHLDEVSDICWSPDGKFLLSGSVDNIACIWDVFKGQRLHVLGGHKHFVQGVVWDPLNQYVCSLSSDRNLRIFNPETTRTIFRVHKATIPVNDKTYNTRLFFDDTLRSYCRRFCFSPNGEFILASSGIVEIPNEDNPEEISFFNCVYLFKRESINKPAAYFSTGKEFNLSVSCCPVIFKLHEGLENPFSFQYRIVFAVATQKSILLFDTQSTLPFAYISGIHYTCLSDISWSKDGLVLMVSSTDGYCTVITFKPNELGEIYDGKPYNFQEEIKMTESPKVDKLKMRNEKEVIKIETPPSNKITKFFNKVSKDEYEEQDKIKFSSCKRKMFDDFDKISFLSKQPLMSETDVIIPLKKVSLEQWKKRMIKKKPFRRSLNKNGFRSSIKTNVNDNNINECSTNNNGNANNLLNENSIDIIISALDNKKKSDILSLADVNESTKMETETSNIKECKEINIVNNDDKFQQVNAIDKKEICESETIKIDDEKMIIDDNKNINSDTKIEANKNNIVNNQKDVKVPRRVQLITLS